MSTQSARLTDDPTLLRETIERQIMQRTWGRIHRLHVEVAGDTVLVRGETCSYYSKQLALNAALDVIGADDLVHLKLDIHVGSK